MAWDKGFDFRDSSGYVTDPTNCTYVLNSNDGAYPTTRNSVTFGWVSIPFGNSRNRTTANDARLAGMNYIADSVQATFQVDLPSAQDYKISAAFNDPTVGMSDFYAQFKDNTTVLTTFDHAAGTGANEYYDASDVKRTSASDWVTNNATIQKTFSSTTFNLKLARSTGNANVSVAHLFLSQVAASATKLKMNSQLNGLDSSGPFFSNPLG